MASSYGIASASLAEATDAPWLALPKRANSERLPMVYHHDYAFSAIGQPLLYSRKLMTFRDGYSTHCVIAGGCSPLDTRSISLHFTKTVSSGAAMKECFAAPNSRNEVDLKQ